MTCPSLRCVWRGIVLYAKQLVVCNVVGHRPLPGYSCVCERCHAYRRRDGRWH
jgi:hypothetical protein